MDTLDPQTGLFYRSALTQSQSTKQQKLSQPQLEQTQLQVKTLQCFQTKQKQTIHLQADQLQHKLTQMPQLSVRHQKLTPLQQEQAQPKPDAHKLRTNQKSTCNPKLPRAKWRSPLHQRNSLQARPFPSMLFPVTPAPTWWWSPAGFLN
ncbi:rCG40008, isoform CRA_c [Rattus norvegicus]|uniref:RCG40008, isoform CRA_c n=1 Tax=Rattus norvegicus TaxID=10116 RepID=A6I6E2_RAT|nr:rCG40008, isoform CRA_c [Rattus norvegicus]